MAKSSSTASKTPEALLKTYFGYDSFRPQQREIIETVADGRDAFVLMPTGGGKSLCYQIPALMKPGLTVVVSPLIALMKDQVDALRANGIAADFLNSSMSFVDQQRSMNRINSGETKLLYVAPERFNGKDSMFNSMLKNANIGLFAIDEAHCVSHWGHDFRPDYLALSNLKKQYPDVPLVALTASADETTRKDIVEKLQLKKPKLFVSSFNRANIRYEVRQPDDQLGELMDFLEGMKGEAGIIYTLKRDRTESLAAALRDQGFNALPYHAGLPRDKRSKHQELFLKDEVTIIVATIAFGMGIDKSNVRFVVHANMPKNIESYYQETGRAGRDGLPSTALLFLNYGDLSTLRYFATIDGNQKQTEIMTRKLDQMVEFCETHQCRRQYLMNYFGEAHPNTCGNCDVCLGEFDEVDYSVDAQKALSGVARLNQQFGAEMVALLLKGSSSKKMQPWMRELKTFGVGKDRTLDYWKNLITELAAQGFLKREGEPMQVYKLTPEARNILLGEQKFIVREARERPKKKVVEDKDDSYDRRLFELLRAERKRIADEENVPPFVVLSDATLRELATYYPQSSERLFDITGFGKKKVQTYGPYFIDRIYSYCKEHGIEEKPIPKGGSGTRSLSKSRRKKPAGPNNSSNLTLKLFQAGKSIDQIAKERELARGTIEGHLVQFVERGMLETRLFMNDKKKAAIEQAIGENESGKLRDIKETLGEDFSYADIRMVLAEKR
jgi:ATP-dependent DNA helicase RecQ